MANSLDHLTNRMKLEWTSQLNTEYVPAKNYRRTSIICTIGEYTVSRIAGESIEKCTANFSGPKTNDVKTINVLRRGKQQQNSSETQGEHS